MDITLNMQVIQIVVPALLTVAGWLVAAWWALEQVSLAHEKNAKLQKELLVEAYRRDIARELVEIYKSITQSVNGLKQATLLFYLNYVLEVEGGIKGVKISSDGLVAPITDAYKHLSKEIIRLDMWLKVSGDHLGNTALLHESIADFNEVFSTSGTTVDQKNIIWLAYQGLLAAYQSNIPISKDNLNTRTMEISASLDSLGRKLTEGAAEINRQLCESNYHQ